MHLRTPVVVLERSTDSRASCLAAHRSDTGSVATVMLQLQQQGHTNATAKCGVTRGLRVERGSGIALVLTSSEYGCFCM